MKRILIAGDVVRERASIPLSYLDAVRGAGAVGTVGLANDEADAAALADAFDALILPGGGDLPSEMFGQAPHPSINCDDPARDRSDKLLLHAFMARHKRVLGICRGCQAASVFLGGTLHQHLPDVFDPVLWHSGNITGRHSVAIEPGSLLASLLGAGERRVNSNHHQAIARAGVGLRISAVAPDGVIEAAEGEGILLLQWHPERMIEEMQPIFQWIVA